MSRWSPLGCLLLVTLTHPALAQSLGPRAVPGADDGASRAVEDRVDALRTEASTLRTYSTLGVIAGTAGIVAGGFTLHRAANPCAPDQDPDTDCAIVNGVEYGMYTLVLLGIGIPTTALSVVGFLAASDKEREANRLEQNRVQLSVAPLPGGALGALHLTF